MTKFTEGPWIIQSFEPYLCSKNGLGEPNPPAAFVGPRDTNEAVAIVFGNPDDEEEDPFDSPIQRANARLMAKSPELFALCEIVYRFVSVDLPVNAVRAYQEYGGDILEITRNLLEYITEKEGDPAISLDELIATVRMKETKP